MNGDWTGPARAELRRLRGPSGAWADRPGGSPRAEPTALAGLALLADRPDPRALADARAAAEWLARLQRPDGAVPIAEGLPGPGWPTPLAILLWASLAGFEGPGDRARRWLLESRGTVLPPSPAIFGHDPTIVGWSWVAGTHSWVEPTAMALLALRRPGLDGHPRAVEGRRLLIDRATPAGGWNHGNPVVFGRPFAAQPAPTGLALLALAGAVGVTGLRDGGPTRPGEPCPRLRGHVLNPVAGAHAHEDVGMAPHNGAASDNPPDTVVRPALAYLEATLPGLRAASSLAWGALGLAAWGRPRADLDEHLAAAAVHARRRPGTAVGLALLLLAVGTQTAGLLGLAPWLSVETIRHPELELKLSKF